MGLYRRYVLPKLINTACALPPMMALRKRYVPSAKGRVLEIGIGSGLNLEFYGDAVDSVTGLTLWRGTTPEHCRLVSRLITDAYVAAVDLSDGLREGRSAAYFYDHRNASGVIPRDGGAPDLGPLTDVRTVLALDHALVIQTGSTIHGYTNK